MPQFECELLFHPGAVSKQAEAQPKRQRSIASGQPSPYDAWCGAPSPRDSTFDGQMLTYGTNPEQLVLAKAVGEALEAWGNEVQQRPDKWNADAQVSVTIATTTVQNLLRQDHDGHGNIGQVAFSQVLAYAWDAGLEVQKVRNFLRPIFPDAASWTKVGDDILAGLQALAAEAGFAVRCPKTVMPVDAYSGLLKISREEQNWGLLAAHYGMLDLKHFVELDGETVFCTNKTLMSGPQFAFDCIGVSSGAMVESTVDCWMCVPRSQHPLSVELDMPTPEEFLTQHDLVGHDGQYAGHKIFAHVYHVCALMLTSQVHDRTGERTMTCLALG